jgi:hypothetical protein
MPQTIKTAQPLSPRTQAFQSATPSGDEEQRLFEEGLSQMAYNVLVSKFPDLIQNVVTFRILDTNVEDGAGIGTFVVQRGNEVIYIPVVMADNQIKPLDLFYHKGLNVFLPLTSDWLDEVDKLTVDEMGEAVRQPQSLRRDVDTRNILIPPTTGRYAYAAARGPLTHAEVTADLRQMMLKLQPRELEKSAAARPAALLDFLGRAPTVCKVAFVNVLTARPKLAAQVTKLYGIEPLCAALEKQGATAGETTTDEEGELNVADRKTTSSKFKEIFGDRAPEAFQGMLTRGYAASDTRRGLSHAVQLQEPKDLGVPDKTGFYRVFANNGRALPAFVVANPRGILNATTEHPDTPEGMNGVRHGGRPPRGKHAPGCTCPLHDEYVVVLKDGRWLRTKKLVAEPAWGASHYDPGQDDTARFNQLLGQRDAAEPKVGDWGMFVKKTGQTFVATEPFKVRRVATDADGVRRVTCDDYDQTVLITDPKAAKAGLHQPKGQPLVYVPPDARFLRLRGPDQDRLGPFMETKSDAGDAAKKEDDEAYGVRLLSNPKDVLQWFTTQVEATGAPKASVKNAGADQFSIDGEPALPKVAAMERLARKHRIHFEAAERLVKQAAERGHGRALAWVVAPTQWAKIAQLPMVDPSSSVPQQGAPTQDPSQAAAAPPAAPSPLDIAMGEAQSQLQQQAAGLQQAQQQIQDTSTVLQQVQQRAQEIASGGAPAVQQGAPPIMPGAAAGASAAPPTAPPAAATPAPSGGGSAPQGAPPQQSTLPQPAQQLPAGGMGAVMETESPSAMEIQQQVNPQFLEQAGQLEDQGIFDAAAIASIGRSPSFRDTVVDYVPTLERALDNLGRVMLTLWLQENELKPQFGEEEFSKLEDNLRAVHEGLGELVLQMNRNATVMPISANS